MANINYFDINAPSPQPKTLDFGEFVSLVKGASITSLAAAGNYVEFGLSDGLNLRIDPQNNITLYTMKGAPPVRLSLIANNETPTAQLVESRLHALRQIYAISFLIDAGREYDIVKGINASPSSFLHNTLSEVNFPGP